MEFTGEFAERCCQKHEHEHWYNDTEPINSKPYIREYEVMEPDFGDYLEIRLRDLNTGATYVDSASRYLENTDINTSVVKKLIGKKIRITTKTQIL